MRRTLLGLSALLFVSVFAGTFACSSDDSTGGGTAKPFEPPTNGVGMPESAACQAIVDAEDARRAALACGPVTRPPCPTYIQKGNPSCSEYDQGTVQGCVAYIGGHATCDALVKKACVVKSIPGSAPNGCPAVDAGSDAPEDAGADVPDDSEADAGADAADAALDAPEDAQDDSPADAAAD
jgi:hypothetical protein